MLQRTGVQQPNIDPTVLVIDLFLSLSPVYESSSGNWSMG